MYAADSDDNDGLASFNINVVGNGGVTVNSAATVAAPRPSDTSGQYAGSGGVLGFNTGLSTGTVSGTGRNGISASQNTAYGHADDPTFDMGILVGVGQENSSASPQNGSQGPIDGSGTATGINGNSVWSYTSPTYVDVLQDYLVAGTLIENGTYTAIAGVGFLTVTGSVQILETGDNGMNETWGLSPYQQGLMESATINPGSFNDGNFVELDIMPEPTSISLLGVFSVAVIASRRFRRSLKIATPLLAPPAAGPLHP